MKVIVQRVKEASCRVDGNIHSEIGKGFCLFVSFKEGDDASVIPWMAKKVANLRIFEDDEGKMNRSLKDVGGSVLSISQFTLEASTKKGNRPSFTSALDPQTANALYETFNQTLKDTHSLNVQTGAFKQHMDIALINDGPVTIPIERTITDD